MKCAVVTPVGPGHEYLAEDSAESVQHAFAAGRGPFTGVSVIRVDDTRGLLGRSAARNLGVAEAHKAAAEWIFFLDADDLMHPGAFAAMTDQHASHDAVWGLICELASDEESYSAREGQLASIERLEHLLLTDPTLTLQMGHFVRTAAAVQTPFNVALDCGEDFDYYLRLWSRFRCRKVALPLFLNRRGYHSTGPRSATGRQWREAVQRIIAARCASEHLVCRFACDGQPFEFRVTNPFDSVQRRHLQGEFFELAELRFLRESLKQGLALMEIGSAGAGNHAVFLARFLAPRYFLILEPDAALLESLKCNLLLNRAANVESRSMTLEARYNAMTPGSAGVLVSGAANPVTPEAIIEEPVEFMKIDIGRMGLDILLRADRIVARCRPDLFVAASNPQLEAVAQWCDDHEYRVVRRFAHANSVNLFLQSA